MVYNQAQTEMKKLLFLVMVLIPMAMIAQNTSPDTQSSAFVGTYSFTDAAGINGTITINSPYKTDKSSNGKVFGYAGSGTCDFNGVTHYFWWDKSNDDDFITLGFSIGDYPAFTVKGNSYKSDVANNITIGKVRYYVKNGWLYYDGPAQASDNPNLRFKLTKLR